MEGAIELDIDVNASVDEVWDAWTTEEGIKTFFAPQCSIELRPGGKYEMVFMLSAKPGERGSEGAVFLALEKPRMLSFTWNAPTELPDIRRQRTHVTLTLTKVDERVTKVKLVNDGYGSGGQWKKALEYFERAWGKIVLPRLRHRFDHGPIDWEKPPEIDA